MKRTTNELNGKPDYLLAIAFISALLVGYLASFIELSQHNDEWAFHAGLGFIFGLLTFVSVLGIGLSNQSKDSDRNTSINKSN